MPKNKSWSGNDTSDFSLSGDELSKLASFCQKHKEIHIFGAGKIGQALKHYLVQSELTFTGFISSDIFDEFKQTYRAGETGIVIGVSDAYLCDIKALLNDLVAEKDIFTLSSDYRERIGNQLSLDYVRDNFWINIFATNRCSLGCKSCSTFSPITALSKIETDYDFDVFKRDIEQLYHIGLRVVSCIKFTGGEPFLHPQLFDMFAVARLYFPQVPIECYTNGTLLSKISADQLNLLKSLNITLTITEYPLKSLRLKHFYKTADNYNINYNVIFSDTHKMFSKRPLNFDKQTPKYCFFDCPRYTMCNSLFLYYGKLWKCVYSFNSRILNSAFSTNFKLTDEDFLNLYDISADAIYNYAISRIPFCGYCQPITNLVSWELSKRKIEEWT